MDLKGCGIKGGVLIAHQIHEGKHQYEVENVIKYKRMNGEKMFVRKGDKLMQINGIDLDNVTPEELAQTLADGSPMLTVHKAGGMKEHNELPPLTEGTLRPISKETTMFSFSTVMRREEDLDNEVTHEEEGKGEEGLEGDKSPTENEENGDEGGLLVVSMTKTSISVVRGRGCDSGSHCQGCHGTGCTVNEIVVVSESTEVTLVPRGGGSFIQEKSANYSIKNVATQNYIHGVCPWRYVYASPNPEKFTIYTYKSVGEFRGVPVVLNLTESDCFLRCYQDGERILLQLEPCQRQRLKRISESDESTLSYVFYMKTTPPRRRKFESALHRGWFIQNIHTDQVEIGPLDPGQEELPFIFIIQK